MNKKLKPGAKIALCALAALLVLGIILVISSSLKKNSSAGGTDQDDSGTQAQLVESEGDIEIIVPEDQESDGF